MISVEAISMIALYAAIGGQYLVLFKIYQGMNDLKIELATCPYHRTGRRPPGVMTDE
ncbi:hypothetical protein R6Y95_06210 [Methanoculleus palmolei]|uniref:Uncharacterized protein n=1 Tax=Methanoculleus palmolei TaxID=72612 RepID=A0ABD8A6B4_9EURY|nr:hypothetical protein R6Y95_06210 [Methanoculleus palmolei]